MLQAADLGTPNRTPQSIQFIAALHLFKKDCTSSVPPRNPASRPGRSVRGVHSLPWTVVVSRVVYVPPSYMFPIVTLLPSSCCSILVAISPQISRVREERPTYPKLSTFLILIPPPSPSSVPSKHSNQDHQQWQASTSPPSRMRP